MAMAKPPLISCIMPTTAARARMWKRAIAGLGRQTHPRRELVIIIEDGDDAAWSELRDVVICAERESLRRPSNTINVFQCPGDMTLGQKRNLACALAEGDIIAHWDDDDWYSPQRLDLQIGWFAKRLHADQVCGSRTAYFDDRATGKAYLYRDEGPVVNVGSTLMYTKKWWEKHKFEHVNVGEDLRFVQAAASELTMRYMDWAGITVAVQHGGNTCRHTYTEDCWKSIPREDLPPLYLEDRG